MTAVVQEWPREAQCIPEGRLVGVVFSTLLWSGWAW